MSVNYRYLNYRSLNVGVLIIYVKLVITLEMPALNKWKIERRDVELK